MEQTLLCCECGEELSGDEAYSFEGEHYCMDCLDEVTGICDCCGERVSNEEIRSDENYALCTSCFDDHYCYCERCGRIIANEDAYYLDDYDEYPYCYACYQREIRQKKIHDYGYKPDPRFLGEGKRYFGVELEVDDGGCDDGNAEEILEIANSYEEEKLYIKRDGSLEDGMELVTHPMTLDYHKNSMPWREIMQRLISMGYLSHKTSTCGLHCHINRSAFGKTTEEQEAVIARILYFVEHHWAELLRFSRRTRSQMERWANRYGMKNHPKELMDDVKSRCSNRYTCINIQNYHTIEFRMFRGTLKYNTFIATLQLVNAICDVAVFMSDDELPDLSWSEFVAWLDKERYTELITYLKERNLYINEPVEVEEDA